MNFGALSCAKFVLQLLRGNRVCSRTIAENKTATEIWYLHIGAGCVLPLYSFSLKVIIENLQIPAGVVKDMVNAHLPQPKIDILMLWYPAYPSWRPGKHSFKTFILINRFNFVSSWLKGYSRAKLGNPACRFKVFGLNSNTSKKRKFPVQCSMCVSDDIST